MAKTVWAAKCSNCGTENKITSVYFDGDEGANINCSHCGKRYYANKPNSPFKKTGEAIAYAKCNA